ncbi:MAG: hypothetical protein ACYC4R_02120 [Anaerolineae bacterium]
MNRRWIIYLAAGILFGVLDYVYLGFLYAVPWEQVLGERINAAIGWFVSFVVMNLGVWLIPAIPTALHEARVSGSRWRAALATLITWSAAIVAYYLTNALELAFWGVPGREELLISNVGSPLFWPNWASAFRGDILHGITEWILVAIVGGAVVGFLVSALYLHWRNVRRARGQAIA